MLTDTVGQPNHAVTVLDWEMQRANPNRLCLINAWPLWFWLSGYKISFKIWTIGLWEQEILIEIMKKQQIMSFGALHITCTCYCISVVQLYMAKTQIWRVCRVVNLHPFNPFSARYIRPQSPIFLTTSDRNILTEKSCANQCFFVVCMLSASILLY